MKIPVRFCSDERVFMGCMLVLTMVTAGCMGVVAQTVPEGEVASDALVAEGESASVADVVLMLESNIAEVEVLLTQWGDQEAASAEGLTPFSHDALQARLSAYRKLLIAYQRHLSALLEYEEFKETRVAFEEELRSFHRLPEDPPYTMHFLDGLYDVHMHKMMDVEAEALSLRALRELASMERADIAVARAAVNRAIERLRTATADDRPAVEFEVETARILAQANEAEFRAAEMELRRTETHSALLEGRLEHAQRKVAFARRQTLFKQEELEEIRARQTSIIETLAEEGQRARNDIDRHRGRLPAAERALDRAAEPEAQLRAREELELIRRQVEASRIELAILESLQEYERDVISLWEMRFDVANPTLARERLDWDGMAARLRERMEVLSKERAASDRRALSLRGQITALERRLEDWKPEEGDRRHVEQQLQVLREREKVRGRIQLRLSQIGTLAERILEEVRARQADRSLMQRLHDHWETARAYVAFAFDREITEIGGESITGRKVFYMVLILVVGLASSRLFTHWIVRNTLERFQLRSNVILIFAKLTNYVFFLLVVYFALNYVNIPLTIFTFMGGAIALGVGFGAQNLINNFLSGLILMGEQPIRMGDIVEVDGKLGTVTNIGARASRLRMFNGFDLLIPNSTFLESNLINWTLSDKVVRLQVEVGVAYGSPTRDVARLMMRAVSEHGLVLEEPEPKVIFEAFGDNTLNFTVYFWVELGPTVDGRVVMSDIRHRIDKLFREGDIMIAFPQRDIHLDSVTPIEVRLTSDDAQEESQSGPDELRAGHLP